MPVEIKIPEVGESITEGVLVEWSVSDGALVAVEDQLLVLETDKITMNVTAENAGRLKILVAEGETVEVGQVVGTIDTAAAADAADEHVQPAEQALQSPAAPEVAAAAPQTPPEITGLSPAVQRMVLEHGVDPTEIEGTGKDGRILKGDVIRFVESRTARTASRTSDGSAHPRQPPQRRSRPPHLHRRSLRASARPGHRCPASDNDSPSGWSRCNTTPPS